MKKVLISGLMILSTLLHAQDKKPMQERVESMKIGFITNPLPPENA